MSKELTPVEAFEKILDMAHEPNGYQNFTNACDTPYTKLIQTALEELKSYKDIEAELGVNLTTLFKALKKGCWIKYKKPWETKYKIEFFEPDEFAICFHDGLIVFCKVRYYGDEYDWGRSFEIEGDLDETHYFGTSNYGKTWALSREELEEKSHE